MNRLIIQIILAFAFISSSAQNGTDNKELKSIFNHALDNINVFEKVLNLLAASNNPEEKKMIISNCKETIFDKSSKIEDDLNPKNIDLQISNFIEVDSYLELFPLILRQEDNTNAVKFSNIYISNVHTIDYKYIRIYFDCFFKGVHKTLNEKFKTVPRVATIRVYQKQNGISTRIVSIKFASPEESALIKRESDVWIEKSDDTKMETKIGASLFPKVEVIVNTEPSGAKLSIDDEPIGDSNLRVKLDVGTYTIKAEKDAYVTESWTITVDGKDPIIEYTLPLGPITYDLFINSKPIDAELLMYRDHRYYLGSTPTNINFPYGNYEIIFSKKNYFETTKTINVTESSSLNVKLFPSKFGIIGADYGLDQIRINGGFVFQGILLSGGVQINLNSNKRLAKTDLAIENVSVYDNELYKEEIGRIYSKSSIPHSFNLKTGYTITKPIFIILTIGVSFIVTDEFQNVFEAKHDYMAEDSGLIINKGDLFPEPFLKKNAYTAYTAGIILPLAQTFYLSTDYYSNSDMGSGFSIGIGLILK